MLKDTIDKEQNRLRKRLVLRSTPSRLHLLDCSQELQHPVSQRSSLRRRQQLLMAWFWRTGNGAQLDITRAVLWLQAGTTTRFCVGCLTLLLSDRA